MSVILRTLVIKFKSKIFDIKLYPASENYVDRIKEYIN